ncbi:MAG: NAD-dependent epimerase/dehydratase family protein [Bacteroidales bacterium]|nr:NAD-dependent epimerase/dehydratase family protein [Bacteroidales bacterium]
MKILITGGAGYVGNELVFELLKVPQVEKVVVYDNLSRKNYNLFLDTRYEPHKIQFVNGELLDSRKLKKELKDIDVVFHLAAIVSTPYATENSHLFEQVNHWGTAELVYAIEESNVKKFIYLSTTSVYGASDETITIDTLPDPKTFYGSSKLRGEKHVERLLDKMDAWIIRCGNVYGYSPSVRFDAVINRFMFEVNFMGRIQINGNGQQTRAFIHVDKVVRVLRNLINPEFSLSPGIYNLVDQNLSIFGIANTIKEIYSHMDMIFVNQHLVMREIKVEKDQRIEPLKTIAPITVKEELINFRNKFSFSSKFDH